MLNNETSNLLPSSSSTLTGANNRRSNGSRLAAAVGDAAATILVFIGVAIIFYTSQQHHDGSASSLLNLSFLGKGNKQSSKQKKGRDRLEDSYNCEKDDKYSKVTLKRAYELPFAALFFDHRGQKKYEASDVTIVDGKVYVSHASLHQLCYHRFTSNTYTNLLHSSRCVITVGQSHVFQRTCCPSTKKMFKLEIQTECPMKIRAMKQYFIMRGCSM